jgi:hypothetical protein
VRELEIWVTALFAIMICWTLFGSVAFSHSYVLFMSLDESLHYDSTSEILAGGSLVLTSSIYVAAALGRLTVVGLSHLLKS